MTPESAAALVARWVRRYTRGLPESVAARRAEELRADVHDQIDHQRAAGLDDRQIARSVVSRTVRGLPADLTWRRRHSLGGTMKTSVLRVAVGVAVVLAIPAVGMLVSDGVDWSVGDFVLAALLLAVVGVALELAVRRAGSAAACLGIGTLGVVAAVAGNADDAPGLVLVGLLLLVAAGSMAVRRPQGSRSR